MRRGLALVAGLIICLSAPPAATARSAAPVANALACSGAPWLKETNVTFGEPGTAVFHAIINPCAVETAYQFEWAAVGSAIEEQVPVPPGAIGDGTEDVEVEQTINVTPGVSYLYRVAIYSEGGTFYSQQHEFTAPVAEAPQSVPVGEPPISVSSGSPRCHCPRATRHCRRHGHKRRRGCGHLAFNRGVRAVHSLAAELCVKRCTSWRVKNCRRLTTQKVGCRFVAHLPEDETCTARIYAFLLEKKGGGMTLVVSMTTSQRACPAELGAESARNRSLTPAPAGRSPGPSSTPTRSGSGSGCPLSGTRSFASSARPGQSLSVPAGATQVQLCRHYHRGGKSHLAPPRLLENVTAIRSLTRALNALPPLQRPRSSCSRRAGWVELFFDYPDGFFRVEVDFGCHTASGAGGRAATTSRLTARLVKLTLSGRFDVASESRAE